MQNSMHELHHRDKATLCNPWQQLPAQFFSANQSSTCWQNGSTSMLACPGGSGACFSSTHPMLREQLKTWWAAGGALSVREGGTALHGCEKCAVSEQSAGRRPCSRAQERQESFVLDLVAAFGLTSGGTFVEMGGHDGIHVRAAAHMPLKIILSAHRSLLLSHAQASNSIHMEYCRGWRGLLIEPNYVAFARLLKNRPGVLAIRGAVCASRGVANFATRRSKGLARKGIVAPASDLTGGLESLMGRTFEKAGYTTAAPTAWLNDPERALRFKVPCAPFGELLAKDLGVKRIDVLWLE